MSIKMKYKNVGFEETLEIDYKIEMIVLTQTDLKTDDVSVVTFIGDQTRDLYELLKDMYDVS